MSGGLADISDANLMQMLAAARAGGNPPFNPAPAAPPAGASFTGDAGALPIRVRPNNAGSVLADQPAGPGLSHLSDDDLMSQLAAARKAATPTPAGPVTREDFAGRIAGDGSDQQIFASNTAAQDTPLGHGLRARADEQLVGPPSARNATLAALYNAGSGASLNLAGNAAAGIATIAGKFGAEGYSPDFAANRTRFDDQRAAFARQHPVAGGVGTAAGIVGGGLALPGLAGAPAASLAGRVGQAMVTGAGYGGLSEAFDSGDAARAGAASLAGGAAGATLGYGIEKLLPVVAPVVSRLLGRGVPFRDAAGNVTAEGQAALREVGVDAAQIPQDVMAQIEQAFATKGASPAVAREALAGEFNIPLSRAQATLDPRAATLEQAAAGGTRGAKAQEIAQNFTARQNAAFDAARGDIQGMAARGTPILENPAAASEAISDRARQAVADNTFSVAAAQRAEDEALRAARGRGTGDALDAATAAQAGIREAAGQSRQGYRDAYSAVGAIPGEFRPGAFDRVGERARADLGPSVPIDPVVTPQTAKALEDLDNLPRLLAKPDGSGPTPADAETFRRRLLARRSAVDPRNATDRMGVDSAIRTYTNHLEGAEGAGLFGPRQAAGAPNSAADGFPGMMATPAGPAAAPAASGAATRAGEPETLTRFLGRSGGIPLDAEARAADLHRAYTPGQGTLARNDAPTWDQIRVRLNEEGFLPPGMDGAASSRDVADWVRNAVQAERTGGRPVVRMGEEGGIGDRRAADSLAGENAAYAERLAPFRQQVVDDLAASGIQARDVSPAHLDDAAGRLYRREHETGADAFEAAVMARDGGAAGRPVVSSSDFVPFDGPTAQAASSALPGGSTELGDALRNARGLFRQHVQAFKPRGPGDDAGQLMQKIVERDMTPAEIAASMFGSATRPGERGLSVRFASRLREALGSDSPVLGAVQQGLIAHALDGNGTGDVGRRLDVLLRNEGKAAANAILTPDQRGALGAFRAALYETERRRQALPDWLTGLARKDFDPNAITADLFGSGVPGARVGSASYARALKGFLGEGSEAWSNVRQAAVSRLLRPDGRDLSPVQEADRIRAFVQGDGAKFAEHLFDGEERARLMRYGAALRSTVLPNGLASPDSGRRSTVAHLLNGILGAVAFKATGSTAAAAAPFTGKVGQRAVIGGPGAFMASRSFSSGAPQAVAPPPTIDLQRIGSGAGEAARYALPGG
ncbi:hypothetical protein MKK63_03475 [Methylobacterium sp. J-088]|uniref:hypothetical protein n=1 Tax=Methylobacterium sp. J-088 TaxID=2836664 RepID=UPI001FB8C96A|nr:hypothetical protein [Methylobacterium sp. J-088]MCJ2061766.1 hypothetical protein [Methylobacterium sp. J-088]